MNASEGFPTDVFEYFGVVRPPVSLTHCGNVAGVSFDRSRRKHTDGPLQFESIDDYKQAVKILSRMIYAGAPGFLSTLFINSLHVLSLRKQDVQSGQLASELFYAPRTGWGGTTSDRVPPAIKREAEFWNVHRFFDHFPDLVVAVFDQREDLRHLMEPSLHLVSSLHKSFMYFMEADSRRNPRRQSTIRQKKPDSLIIGIKERFQNSQPLVKELPARSSVSSPRPESIQGDIYALLSDALYDSYMTLPERLPRGDFQPAQCEKNDREAFDNVVRFLVPDGNTIRFLHSRLFFSGLFEGNGNKKMSSFLQQDAVPKFSHFIRSPELELDELDQFQPQQYRRLMTFLPFPMEKDFKNTSEYVRSVSLYNLLVFKTLPHKGEETNSEYELRESELKHLSEHFLILFAETSHVKISDLFRELFPHIPPRYFFKAAKGYEESPLTKRFLTLGKMAYIKSKQLEGNDEYLSKVYQFFAYFMKVMGSKPLSQMSRQGMDLLRQRARSILRKKCSKDELVYNALKSELIQGDNQWDFLLKTIDELTNQGLLPHVYSMLEASFLHQRYVRSLVLRDVLTHHPFLPEWLSFGDLYASAGERIGEECHRLMRLGGLTMLLVDDDAKPNLVHFPYFREYEK